MYYSIGMDNFPHILVVDDDSRLRELLRQYLQDNDFSVSVAADATEARRLLDGIEFDLIILDVMMPGDDGFTLTQTIREKSAIPILMLTARVEVEDRIQGLEKGVDDYLSKPFEPRELLLRLSNILKRVGVTHQNKNSGLIIFGDCVFDASAGVLKKRQETIHLTSVEENLLRILLNSKGEPVSREALLRESRMDGNERTIDVQVNRLRQKIETVPKWPRYLRTVRGRGYLLQTDRS